MGKKNKHVKQKEDQVIDIPAPHSIEQETLRMKNVAEFAKFSFELEEKREQSVINQAGQMLMAFSVTSVAELMAVPILIEHTNLPDCMILFSSGLILTFLLASMTLAIISQWRFHYKTMFNGKELLQRVEADVYRHAFQPQYDFQWILQLSAIQESKKKNNDIRCNLIQASMIAFFVAVACVVVCSVIIVCLQ